MAYTLAGILGYLTALSGGEEPDNTVKWHSVTLGPDGATLGYWLPIPHLARCLNGQFPALGVCVATFRRSPARATPEGAGLWFKRVSYLNANDKSVVKWAFETTCSSCAYWQKRDFKKRDDVHILRALQRLMHAALKCVHHARD